MQTCEIATAVICHKRTRLCGSNHKGRRQTYNTALRTNNATLIGLTI